MAATDDTKRRKEAEREPAVQMDMMAVSCFDERARNGVLCRKVLELL